MSVSLDEFIELVRQKYGAKGANRVELAIDGIFWREPDCVIARYSHMQVSIIRRLRTQVKAENNRDYFTI